jgi:thioredoxin-like negative regulator of GroEL
MCASFSSVWKRSVLVAALTLIASPGSIVLYGQEQPAPTPSPADTLFQSGFALLSQGKYQEAEETFRKVYAMDPVNSRGILGVAAVYLAQKKNEEALQLLQAEAERDDG